ncbi:MAG: alpha/beta hydrolase [Gammaproteobacteria bacterium]|jgi:pimeloyl-ACP methyl ester carboxylesterase|nr:alpha/beta hydrolase [Gammaproteobacteria bacterium]
MPYVNRDGVNVYYESLGQGLPIVFLHPWSTNRYIWANQLMEFARSHQCIVVDHRGHGQSDKPAGGYAIGEMAADVVAVLDDAGIERAVLVGNSIGGMVAMQTNLDAPERVIGNLILSSGTDFGANSPPEVAEAIQQDWRGFFSGLLNAAVSEKSKAERPEILGFMEGCFRVDDNFTEGVFFASVADPNGVFNWNISDRLKDITAPTLIIAGEEDGATTVEQNQFLADNIPNSEIKIYKDVAHFCQLEKPLVFNEDLRNFIAGLG